MTLARLGRSADELKRVAFFQAVKSQLGVPYVWGGDTPRGTPGDPSGQFDCSGLVKWAASKIGIDLPHYTVDQFDQLPSVTKPRAGDLVYFDTGAAGEAVPQHVGVCTDYGCTRMINAPYTGANVDVVPTSFGGTVVGFRSVAGNATTGPSGPGGTTGPAGPIAPPKSKSKADTKAVGCEHKGNVFGEGGLPLIHTGSFSFTYCEAKAFLGAVSVGAGGILMLAGATLLAVYGLQRAGLAASPSQVIGGVKGAVAGAAGGPAGAAAGAVTGAASAPKRASGHVVRWAKSRGDADDRRAKAADDADRKLGRATREAEGRKAFKGESHEGAPASAPRRHRRQAPKGDKVTLSDGSTF